MFQLLRKYADAMEDVSLHEQMQPRLRERDSKVLGELCVTMLVRGKLSNVRSKGCMLRTMGYGNIAPSPQILGRMP